MQRQTGSTPKCKIFLAFFPVQRGLNTVGLILPNTGPCCTCAGQRDRDRHRGLTVLAWGKETETDIGALLYLRGAKRLRQAKKLFGNQFYTESRLGGCDHRHLRNSWRIYLCLQNDQCPNHGATIS
jgi:hypothetical protein